MYKNILQDTAHRPHPLPTLPWVMTQQWEHVLFMHWPVPEGPLRKYIPQKLEIDTFNGDAWIGIIAFEVSDLRMRGLPRIPFYNTLLEVNVRTYVKYKGVGGTYFLSLDANKLAVVLGARMLTLPYNNAKIRMKKKYGKINYLSKRKKISTNPQIFHCDYWPAETNFSPAEQGTLTHWLAERYRLWTTKGNTLFQGDIHHRQWNLSPATVKIHSQTLIDFLPEKYLNNTPILHYSPAQRALIWPIRKA